MSPYLPVPQTPSAKTRLENEISEISLVSGQTTPQHTPIRSRSPAVSAALAGDDATIDGGFAKHSRKTASSPHPPRQLERLDVFHRISIGSLSDAYGPMATQPFRILSPGPEALMRPRSPTAPTGRLQRLWLDYRAVIYVFLAQLFGALMNLCARLLELDDHHPMQPLQLLFARMSVTTVVCSIYMYRTGVPHFPLGPPSVRWHLVVRGLAGFCGIFSMWYSMMYLPLAEATVITFLVPSMSGYFCHLLLHEPFTRKEQIGSGIALLGVILIARPVSLFPSSAPEIGPVAALLANSTGAASTAAALLSEHTASVVAVATGADALGPAATNITTGIEDHAPFGSNISTVQRLIAVGVALFGVTGSSCAFTAIRAIGTRAHPLISVNYFSTAGTLVSTAVLVLAPIIGFGQPELHFGMPNSLRQWALLFVTCVCGFLTQLCITKGLGLERSNRASAMIYTNMLFAAGFDRFVFGNQMGIISLGGCGLIIGSALWVALSKRPTPDIRPGTVNDVEIGHANLRVPEIDVTRSALVANPTAESIPMLAAIDSEDEEDNRTGLASHVGSRST
ncbi:duf6 domain containing protein [Grosmannia clavigera kw1407]|uniref:Duf6 domain containing protein n=1 Tax=Grosmannia clavigera (strain kw1407 / UAMH 11150) TaxID=655863 RepID=F0XD50_GROCL|nr:duf6 domain containing protein [Grosmannia clavigera kw1407]EFX03754.1 duf6 domain containing protein [Grosmannia clavigera kw1407]